MSRRDKPTPCPCGSGRALPQCCGPYLEGARPAPTAEALMRSRYTAYALGAQAYLLATWHPSTRPSSLEPEQAPPPRWIGLSVHRHENLDPARALVEFTARCRVGGRAQLLHETSRFLREGEHWFYVDGDLHE